MSYINLKLQGRDFHANIPHTLRQKEVWYKMETRNNIQINRHELQLVFLELLYKEKLINKETYYAAKATLRSECKKE